MGWEKEWKVLSYQEGVKGTETETETENEVAKEKSEMVENKMK